MCYRRNYGDVIPICCDGRNEDVGGPPPAISQHSSTNLCVPAGCAAYTQDDDDAISAEFKIQQCVTHCYANSDCAGELVCKYIEIGDNIPGCCENTTGTVGLPIVATHAYSICAPQICDRHDPVTGAWLPPLPPSVTLAPTVQYELDPDALTANFDEGLCFSGETLVHILGKGPVPMKKLQVQDRVLTAGRDNHGNHHYQPVYAFAHMDRHRTTRFLQIVTNGFASDEEAALEVTAQHLVFVHGKRGPVCADTIRVGDLLQTVDGLFQQNVTAIYHVTRKGLYAPLTPDGTIVVADGILASNYITVQAKAPTEYVELSFLGTLPFLHQADVVHMWLSPLRMLCIGFFSPESSTTTTNSMCHTYTKEGMLHYVEVGLQLVRHMEEKPLLAQLLVLIPLLLCLRVCTIVEYAFGAATTTSVTFLLIGVCFAASRGRFEHGTKRTTPKSHTE